MGLGEGSHCDEKVDRLGRWKQGPAVRKCTEWASGQVSIRQAHQSQPWNRQYWPPFPFLGSIGATLE